MQQSRSSESGADSFKYQQLLPLEMIASPVNDGIATEKDATDLLSRLP
jgi:hypothetical protein